MDVPITARTHQAPILAAVEQDTPSILMVAHVGVSYTIAM